MHRTHFLCQYFHAHIFILPEAAAPMNSTVRGLVGGQETCQTGKRKRRRDARDPFSPSPEFIASIFSPSKKRLRLPIVPDTLLGSEEERREDKIRQRERGTQEEKAEKGGKGRKGTSERKQGRARIDDKEK